MGSTGNSGQIMLHHSRNTAQKQWSETQVLTLAGVAQVFIEKRALLLQASNESSKQSNQCPEAWLLLLQHVQQCAQSRNSEVSLSALECLQDLLRNCSSDPASVNASSAISESMWDAVWNCWCEIGINCVSKRTDKASPAVALESNGNAALARLLNENNLNPSQAFLLMLVKLFKQLYPHLKQSFSLKHFERLSAVFTNAMSVPLDTLSQSLLLSEVGPLSGDNLLSNGSSLANGSSTKPLLTPLQQEIFSILSEFRDDLLSQLSASNASKRTPEVLLASLFGQYLSFAAYAWQPPTGNAQIHLSASALCNPTVTRGSLLSSHTSFHAKYQLPNAVSTLSNA
jgi:hypothetical protein